jgi:hypothetical protein
MRVVLRRRVDDPKRAGPLRYRQTVLEVARIGIGRGADQLIQILDAEVAPAHALIEQHRGALRLRALTAAGIEVNGVLSRQCTLRRGDVLTLAGRHVTIEDLREDGVVVVRLGLPIKSAQPQEVAALAQSLNQTSLRAAPVSWLLVLGLLGLTFFAPLLASRDTPLRAPLRDTPLLPSDALWLPGPLDKAHQSIGGNCNACHGAAFQRVTDRACSVCHPGVQQHVPVTSPARATLARLHCRDCHLEHGRPSILIETNSSRCVGCHAHLNKVDPLLPLQNVTDFGTGHPGFTLALLEPPTDPAVLAWTTRFVEATVRPPPEEHSNLKFSHQVHLDPRGIKSPAGRAILKCVDCHRSDAGGEHMAPIRMEQHCGACHLLLFDEHDPTSKVPHGALPPLFTALEEHFSRMFLQPGVDTARVARRRPGGEAVILSQEEQRRALDWALNESERAAGELLERRVCVECHTVTRRRGVKGLEQWRVEPVKLTSRWMPRAEFSHAKHRSSACLDCHVNAATSQHSTDVLLPTIKECRECHGGALANSRLASDCTMCHRLHVPGRGDYVTLSGKPRGPERAAGAPR